MAACIFCSIVEGKVSAAVVMETSDVIVIKDRAPKAPVHYLIISKKHVVNIKELERDDVELAAHLLLTAKALSQTLPANQQDFRLVSNNGKNAGQVIYHLHIHFLAGTVYTD